MSELPRGTVAFLFTDIEGSTRLWTERRAAMAAASARHDAVLREAVAQQGGVVYKVIGDAIQAVFPTAEAAAVAALEAQLGLGLQPWRDVGLPSELSVRMAVHAGAVDPDADGDYRSPVLNRLGRLLGVAHGGQVLLSQAAADLARDRLPDGAALSDLGAHRLKDLLEPERILQLAYPGLPSDFPPLATLDRARHNLPLQLTPAIGREREIAELTALLRRPEGRLVTLLGPGGTGKTRLALQTAAELVDDFPDGVWFVPLAALNEPAQVASAIAEALAVRESAGALLPEVQAALREKRLLLVLDNFEHLIGAAPTVAALLAAAPDARALVTSRAPLRLRGEREFAVPPLGLPRRTPPPAAEQLSHYAAVRLFIERAQAVRADFTVDAANAPAIAEICWRLDGLPLAIELAAARVRLLTPQTMLPRLEQRLALLTDGARDLPSRQQTLSATIAWSHDLLDDPARALFRRLGVFEGSFSLAAAEAVGGAEALDRLQTLAGQSLIAPLGEAGEEPRFRLLETIRAFAIERLTETGEREALLDRVSAWLLARIAPDGSFADHESIEPDWPTIETALDHLAARGRREEALALLIAVAPDRINRGRCRVVADRLQRALAGMSPTPAQEADALLQFAAALHVLGRHDEETRALDRADALAAAGDRRQRFRTAYALGKLHFSQGRQEAARAELERAMAEAGDEATARIPENMLAFIHLDRNDLPAASAIFRRHADFARREGDRHGLGIALGNLASAVGDRGEAIALLREAEALLAACHDRDSQAQCLAELGALEAETGDGPRGVAHIELGLAMAQEDDNRWAECVAWRMLGRARLAVAEPAAAATALRESLRLAREIGVPLGVGWALAELARATPDPDAAARLAGAADGARARMGLPPESPRGEADPLGRLRADPALAEAYAAGRALDDAGAAALGQAGSSALR